MKKTLVGLSLALAISNQAMAMNPWKALAAALASFSIAQGAFDQCETQSSCVYHADYDSFGDYLEGLTTCEKEQLFPSMEARQRYIAVTQESFRDKVGLPSFSRAEAIKNMRDIEYAYRTEIKLLNAELQKVQEVFFDDCTTEESKEILAKHSMVLADGIRLHTETLEGLQEYLRQSVRQSQSLRKYE